LAAADSEAAAAELAAAEAAGRRAAGAHRAANIPRARAAWSHSHRPERSHRRGRLHGLVPSAGLGTPLSPLGQGPLHLLDLLLVGVAELTSDADSDLRDGAVRVARIGNVDDVVPLHRGADEIDLELLDAEDLG